MEHLNFMYSKTLSTNTTSELLDILIAADKYEVASCMEYCCRLLLNMKMTPEAALKYMELPCSILMDKAIPPLKDAARKFLAVNFNYIVKFQDKLVKICITGLHAILSSDDVKVKTENTIYDLVLIWTRHNYPNLKERQEIIGTHLIHLIRFPYMTSSKLKSVLNDEELDHKNSSRAVLEGVTSKSNRFVERTYIYRPVKVVEFDSPRQQCVVYFDMKWKECAKLFPSGYAYSYPFDFGGHVFFLLVQCYNNKPSSSHTMGQYLVVNKLGPGSCDTFFKFLARIKPTDEYVVKREFNHVFTQPQTFGYPDLFKMTWTDFIAQESSCFINDILHLRAEITIMD